MESWTFTGTSPKAAAVHEALARVNFEADVAKLSSLVARSNRFQVHSRAFPILDVTIEHTRPLRLRMRADNWDELPPAVELLQPDGAALNGSLPGGVFNGGPHPLTGRAFICMRGILEFHTHSGHQAERWDQYRGKDGMGLVGILMQIANAWRSLTR